jgi:hypothetical protein
MKFFDLIRRINIHIVYWNHYLLTVRRVLPEINNFVFLELVRLVL